jgi:hypothetical protein
MRGVLLVTERDVLDAELVTGIDQRVVGVAALSEHFRHALLLEAVGHEHRSSHKILRASLRLARYLVASAFRRKS